jgi:hypothetical protein
MTEKCVCSVASVKLPDDVLTVEVPVVLEYDAVFTLP